MSYCPGSGATEIIPSGPNTSLLLTGIGLTTALAFLGGPLDAIAAGALGVIELSIANLCAGDPPAYPSTTDLATAIAQLLGGPADHLAAVNVFTQYLGAANWSTYCQCVTGPQPTPPAPPSPPTSTPVTPGQPASSGVACSINNIIVASGTWNGFTVVPVEFSFGALDLSPIPYNATTYNWWMYVTSPPPDTDQMEYQVRWYLSDQATLIRADNMSGYSGGLSGTNKVFAVQTGGPFGTVQNSPAFDSNDLPTNAPFGTFTVPAGAAFFGVVANNTRGGTLPTLTLNGRLVFFCGGATSTSTGCCPPDPSILAALNQIQSQLSALFQSLPTAGVTSYATGTAHPGLTDYGALAFSGAPVGVNVTFTIGPGQGSELGEPIFYPDAGWISLVTEQGNLAGVRLEYSGQFIPFPVLVTSLDYSLGPNVTATITEVTAGP